MAEKVGGNRLGLRGHRRRKPVVPYHSPGRGFHRAEAAEWMNGPSRGRGAGPGPRTNFDAWSALRQGVSGTMARAIGLDPGFFARERRKRADPARAWHARRLFTNSEAALTGGERATLPFRLSIELVGDVAPR